MGNPAEANGAPVQDDPAPPPYSEVVTQTPTAAAAAPPTEKSEVQDQAPPYTTAPETTAGPSSAAASASASSAGPSTSAGAGAAGRVGSRFPVNLSAFFRWKFTMTFHLGERKEAPLFAVTAHTGWTAKPLLELHDGPGEDDPIIATANSAGGYRGRDSVLMVGVGVGVGVPQPATRTKKGEEVRMTPIQMPCAQSSWRSASFPFQVEVVWPPGGGGGGKGGGSSSSSSSSSRVERFEWRHSKGAEIRDMDVISYGWKLVRLDGPARSGGGGGGKRAEREVGLTSDGLEVVAAWGHDINWSMTQDWKFRFLGSGATGELGDRWAVTAVISSLKIWHLEYQRSSSTTIAVA
ncbi:hypothetical protein F4778DRAFT_787930 [Xylariomycetidae sp. FL2044]|nr:hypothetical protein F4778DRAFT_787930 [Xylariomycetidae sp. FL2044]